MHLSIIYVPKKKARILYLCTLSYVEHAGCSGRRLVVCKLMLKTLTSVSNIIFDIHLYHIHTTLV